jgi:hypothetical protein
MELLYRDGQSVCQSVSPSETHDQILVVVKTVAVCLSWGVPPVEWTILSHVTGHSPCLR